MRTKLLGGVSLAALCLLGFTPALAAPVVASGDVGGGYSYSSFNNGGGHFNDWMVNGAGVLPIGSNWAVQGNLGYSNLSGSGASEDNTNGVATGFFAGSFGRVGASVGYTRLSASHLTVDVTSYGGFGDWYASDRFTVSARGGGISGEGHSGGGSAHFSGAYYVGGQATGYVTPDLALNGTIDYVTLPVSGTSVQDTTYRVGGEYLLSHSMPLAVSAGYSYSDNKVFGFSANANTFSIALKYYFGGGGSLEDHHRSGAESWGASSPVQKLIF